MNEIHRDPGGGGRGIFDDLRRQMEEMLGGQVKPPRPSALPGGPTVQRGTPASSSTNQLAMTAAAVYWLLPLAAAKKRKRKLRRRAAAARAAAEQAGANPQEPPEN